MMRKCDELRDPHSCFNKASPEEPIFVLRANDPIAAQAIRHWAVMAFGIHGAEKIDDAIVFANDVEQWRNEREKIAPGPVQIVRR
jgi:hypothetical protein